MNKYVKYECDEDGFAEMVMGAKVVSAQNHHGKIILHAVVGPDITNTKKRKFVAVEDGQEFPARHKFIERDNQTLIFEV